MTGVEKAARPARLAAGGMLWLLLLGAAVPAVAQQTGAKTAPPNVKDSDCAKLPGGNAPINMMARLQGGIAVDNLEYTYFGKKLYQLTPQDFAYLKDLIPYCKDQSKEQTDYIIDRLATLVSDAQATRKKSIDWIKETEARLEKMPATRDSIEEVHNIWTELQNRQLEMTKADSDYLAKKLDETRQRLYANAKLDGSNPRQSIDPKVRVSPFMPEIPSDERKPDPG